jgi:hypothetical protein
MRRRAPSSSVFVVAVAVALLTVHAGAAAAQTSMVPYFGKNNIHYDKFEWHIYVTDNSTSNGWPGILKAPTSRSARI